VPFIENVQQAGPSMVGLTPFVASCLDNWKLADAVGANERDIQEGSGDTAFEDPANSGVER